MSLFIPELLKSKVSNWRESGFKCDYPILSEILNYNYREDDDEKIPRYLRTAQIEALETYWYLRVVEKTPHIIDLYQKLISQPSDLLDTLGIKMTKEITDLILKGTSLEDILEQIKTDENFVKEHKLQTVKETISLSYPSYILALAMGSGKTMLIGTIIATEFCLAQSYKGKEFIKNALVFAPGKTILGALKQISDIEFEKILPLKYYKKFMSSLKITYTQDGQKELPVTEKSSYNIIVSNTEKIRIQKQTGFRQTTFLNFKEGVKTEHEEEIANLRLQTIASLPNLGIFSDEGHHTYGQTLDSKIKQVRKTVDYLAESTNVLCVVNTTGTPYYKKQMLKDVIFWYGLSQGIHDGILKEVNENIISYEKTELNELVSLIIADFFTEYKNVEIFDGAKSKLAMYFPKIDDVKKAKPIVEEALIKMGIDPNTILVVHSKSDEDVKDLFNNRVNDPTNSYRVYLLVGMGTEGWNCPSLFATALIRKLTTSNNFILQAASRCLRQIPDNRIKAKIYLSKENYTALDNQLNETYGESLTVLDKTQREMIQDRIIIRKPKIPPIILQKKIKKIKPKKDVNIKFELTKPKIKAKKIQKTTHALNTIANSNKVLRQVDQEEIDTFESFRDIYDASGEISSIFRIDSSDVFEKLSKIYPNYDIPSTHIPELCSQIENQLQKWEVQEENVEYALMIIKPEGFKSELIDGDVIYVTEIMYRKDREHYFVHHNALSEINPNDFGFHYSPYNFDSNPEKHFLEEMLQVLNEKPGDVEDIFFTGGLSSSSQTDILFEYKNDKGEWKNYTPDFIIKKKDGKILIVEVKKERNREDHIEGEKGLKAMALHELENLNPEQIKYTMLFTPNEYIGINNIKTTKKWIYGDEY